MKSLLRVSCFSLIVCSLTAAGCAAPPPPPAPPATLHSSIPAGGQAIAPTEPLVINAAHGTLTKVTVTSGNGQLLPGELNANRSQWTSRAPLAYGTNYRVAAEAASADNKPATPLNSTFHTVNPARFVEIESVEPSNGDTVGVAMPISLHFSRDIVDKAAVERRLSVQPSIPTEGSFHWVSDDQVNWRPKEYWKAGTTVSVESRLYGVDAGSGIFGKADHRFQFHIGRDQRAIGDVNTHRFQVFHDGHLVKDFPASYGRSVYPTQSGIHVAYEKHVIKRMRSDTWPGGAKEGQPGFYDELLPNAVRISANGEFVHVNAATVGNQGESNVSHGCVNLSPADGKWFYDTVQFGDPVEIVGSPKPLTPKDGKIRDWTIPWNEYVQGSALN